MAGIIDTIKLAGTLVFALPAAFAGLDFLLVRGRPAIGATLLALGILLVVVQHYVPLPSSLPELAASKLGGAVVVDPDDETDPRED